MLRITPKRRVLFVHRLMPVLLAVLGVVFVLGLNFFHSPKLVEAATNNTLNFQARLQNASGSIVPDGYYNLEFKLYSGSTGGSALWTEDDKYVDATHDYRVRVYNGYVSVNLGAVTAFPGTINWDQQLWLTMNVGGTTTTASWDGEMSPRLTLTGVPYAFRAGQLAQYNGATAFTSSLSLQGPTGGNQSFIIQDQGAAGTYNLLTAPSGSDGYIKLQTGTPGVQQTGNFNISGTGIASTLQAGTFDTASATTLNIGTTNATSIVLGQNTVVTSGKTISIGSAVTYQAIVPTGTFATKVDYSTGTNPASIVATGDLNGDGKLDAVTVNNTANTASVLLGNGNGTFQTKADYATGSGPQSIIASDLNGDGKLDLVSGNYSAGTISVLLGNGDGTFQTKVDYTTGTSPASVAVGDYNGDGKSDLAVANYTDSTVSILLGNGNGTFQTKVDYTTGSHPRWVTTGDFNGDGKIDLAVANDSGNSVSILLGNGNGTFQTKVDYATATSPASVVTGDFNGDGKLDLATADYGNGFVSVLLGNGNGTFQTKVDYAAGSFTWSVVTGDFNGDGKLDLVAANRTSNTVSVLLGNGNGTFQTKVDYATGGDPRSVAIGDFNGDGVLDLATANYTSSTLSSLIGNTTTASINGGISITTASSSQAGIILQGSVGQSADYLHIQNSSGAALFVVGSSGHLGIGVARPSYAIDVSGDINASGAYRVAGTAGSTTTCTSGNVLQNATVQGGIITGGTCVANGAGVTPTMQDVYNNSTSPATIALASGKGIVFKDNATTVGNIFQIQNSAGSTTYLGVTATGASITGNLTVSNGLTISAGGAAITGTVNLNTSGTATTTIGNASYSSTTNINSYSVHIGQSALTTSCSSFFGYCSTTIAGYMVTAFPSITLYNDQSDSNIQVTGSMRLSGGDDMGFGALHVQNTTSNATNPIEILQQGTTPTSTSDALQIQNSSSIALGGFNYQGNLYYKNGSFTTTVNTTALTANQTITLPNATGTVALTNDTANFIRNQTGVQASSNFNISGTGIANILQAGTFDTAAAGTLNIGTTNATSIVLGQNTSLASGKTFTANGTSIDGTGNVAVATGKTLTANGSGFDGSGNLGIGTTSPGANLDIQSATTTGNAVNLTTNSLTTGSALNISNGLSGDSSGSTVSINQTGTLTNGAGNSVASSLLNTSRNLTANISGGALTVTLDASVAPGSNSTNWPHTVANHSNRILIVQCMSTGGTAPTAITYNSAPFTKAGQASTGSYQVSIWYLIAPSIGTFNVISTGGSCQNAESTSWYNVDQTTGVGAFVSSVTSGTVSVAVASVANGMAVDAVADSGGALSSAGSGQTILRGSGSSLSASYKSSTTSSTTMSWVGTGSIAEGAVGIIPAAAPGLAISGSLASLSSNCTVTAGTCADTSNILNLNQQYSGATGAVAVLQNAGSGDMIDFLNGSGTLVASIGANGNLMTTGTATVKTTSSTALQIQNASGTNTLAVDTSGGRVVIGEDAGYDAALVVGRSTTNPASIYLGISNSVNLTVSTNGGYSVQGQNISLYTDGSANNSNATSGLVVDNYNDNTGALNTGSGTNTSFENGNSGTVSVAQGLNASVTNEGTGSITTAYGGLFGVAATSGSIGTGYGVYINDTQATTSYGLYQAGSNDINYFAGKVGVGTNAPSSLFSVGSSSQFQVDASGNIQTSGNITSTGGTLNIQGTGANTFTGSIDVAKGVSTSINGVRTYENVYSKGTASTTTGTLEIVLPAQNNSMLNFTIKGYEYTGTNGTWQVNVGGFLFTNNTWLNSTVQMSGNAPFTSVRLAYNSTLGQPVLLLGTTSTAWSYPQVSVTQVVAGYANIDVWGNGYTSSYITSETGITNIVSPSVQQTATTSTAFIQGGNSFGAAAVLGTNDSNSVSIKTGGTARFTIDTSGNATFTGSISAGTTVNATTGYQFNGTAGVTTTACTGGQVLTNLTVSGGIITGAGTCAVNGGGIAPTLQDTYNNSTSPATILLNSTNLGLVIKDASTTVGTLFSVVNNGGTTKYFSVTANGIQSAALDTPSAGALTVGGSNATSIVLGNSGSGNYITFTAAGGLNAFGTARHTKNILLTPEFAGAVLDAQSDATCTSATNGTMTSGYDSTGRMNYYDWTSSGSAQCYDVVVQVALPSDFDSWSGTPNIQMKKDSTGTAAYAIQIIPSSGTDTNYSSYISPGTLSTSWGNMATTSLSGTYTAGDYMTIKVRLTSTSGANVQLGNIKLTYNSKF